MRCLILGGTGLIGSHLMAACADRRMPHLGSGYRRPRPEFAPVDIRDADGIGELIGDYQPDVTFLAAGISDAGYAASFPRECDAVNRVGAVVVARCVAKHGGTLVAFSPDTVFGDCGSAMREEDATAATTPHARTAVAAEKAVRDLLPNRHLILRTGWVFADDARHRGAAGRFLRSLERGETVEAAKDRFGQPTFAPDLAEAALELARMGQTGMVHCVGPEKHSEFSFARLVAHLLGHDADLVVGGSGGADGRPARTWLDRFQLRSLLGPKAIRPAGDGLRAMRDEAAVLEPVFARAA